MGKKLRQFATDHEVSHPDRIEGRGGPGRDHPAVPQHRDAVRDGRNLGQAMRNVEDSDTPRLEAADHVEERLGLDRRQGGGRLVEDHDAMLDLERAGDLHELTLRDRQPRNGPPRIDLGAQRPHGVGSASLHGPIVHHEPSPDLTPHEDVARNREVRRQEDLLVDQHDAASLGLLRPGETDGLARHRHRAAGGYEIAGQELHQGRLAGAVLTDDRMHLARHERERDVAQHLDGPEPLREPTRFQDRNGSGAAGRARQNGIDRRHDNVLPGVPGLCWQRCAFSCHNDLT